MGLPQAIQNQVDQADQIISNINGVVPPAGDTQASNDSANAPVPQPAAPIAQVAPVAHQTENFEARFHSLRGKYDAEVPRLAQQVREQQAALQTLISENQNLKQRPVAAQAPLVTDADKAAFGDDLVDMVDRLATQKLQAVEARIEQMRSENERLKGQIGNVNEQVAVGAKDRFLQQLTAAVPDWQAVNADQGFLLWLGATDPVYGLPRQAGLDNAYNQLDAARTALIFESYKQSTGAVTPAKTLRQELQSQVAPTRSRNTAPPAMDNAATRIWTQQEISAAYSDMRRGNLTDDVAARVAAEIDTAVAEGRVT